MNQQNKNGTAESPLDEIIRFQAEMEKINKEQAQQAEQAERDLLKNTDSTKLVEDSGLEEACRDSLKELGAPKKVLDRKDLKEILVKALEDVRREPEVLGDGSALVAALAGKSFNSKAFFREFRELNVLVQKALR